VVGADLWVGYWIDQQEPSVFTAGVDAGPANPNGDWIATGGSWGHLSSNPDLDANWNIRATLTGTPQVQWLSADPMSGMLAPGESATVEVTLDATDLEVDIYEGQLRVHTNAPENPRKDVSVMLNVITGLDENAKENLMVYPVPATDYLNLQSSVRINEVRLVNYVGQVVHEDVIGNQQTRIDINSFDSGVYILEVNTEEGRFTQKVVIE
ncbi:MAG: T9SS type A sorting domain-containing protein, partial [Bacteroidales bacterium]|nr:T9SS type A sorting domain-containing protein [Bacteroidales bacterium]